MKGNTTIGIRMPDGTRVCYDQETEQFLDLPLHPWTAKDYETLVQNEHKLYKDAIEGYGRHEILDRLHILLTMWRFVEEHENLSEEELVEARIIGDAIGNLYQLVGKVNGS